MADPRLTAFKLIRTKGRLDGALRRPGADAVQNGKPWAPADADPTVVPLMAKDFGIVVLDKGFLPPASIQALAPEATAMGLVAAMDLPRGTKFQVGDLVETKGERYAVLAVDELAPAGDDILFTLSLKAR